MKHRKKVAVIGFPVKQSLSPALHGYWQKKYGIEGEYGMLEVPPEELEATLLSLKDLGYAGCNLTIPHKEAALKIVKDISPEAQKIGAVNTIVVQENGKLFGTNTDAYGFIENIKQAQPDFDFRPGCAVVLGAGGAARAVMFGLLEQGVPEIILLNRSKEKASALKRDFAEHAGRITIGDWDKRDELLDGANLLVNTTSLGMAGQPELGIDLGRLPVEALVTDIVYKPLETTLLKNARMRGNVTVDGLGMLLYQAQGGFEMWFGIRPEVTEELREHVLRAMGQ